jgi:hypothetical protein
VKNEQASHTALRKPTVRQKGTGMARTMSSAGSTSLPATNANAIPKMIDNPTKAKMGSTGRGSLGGELGMANTPIVVTMTQAQKKNGRAAGRSLYASRAPQLFKVDQRSV